MTKKAEEIVEEVLYRLDHRHYSEDFKADQIIAALDEAGFIIREVK